MIKIRIIKIVAIALCCSSLVFAQQEELKISCYQKAINSKELIAKHPKEALVLASEAFTNYPGSPPAEMYRTLSETYNYLIDNKMGLYEKTICKTDTIDEVLWSKSGAFFVTRSHNSGAKLWGKDGKLLTAFDNSKYIGVICADISPDENYIVAGCHDDIARVWDVEGNLVTVFHQKGEEPGGIFDVHFSPDSKTILSTSSNGASFIWNLAGDTLASISDPYCEDIFKSSLFSPDGSYVAITDGNELKLYNLKGKLLNTLKERCTIHSFALSGSGEYIATGASGNEVHIWNKKGKRVQTLKNHRWYINRIQFSKNDSNLITISSEGLYVWKLHHNKYKFHKHIKIDEVFRDGQISEDGKIILTRDYSTKVNLWSVDGEFIARLHAHDDLILDAKFSPNHKQIITTSRDKMMKMWDLDSLLITNLYSYIPMDPSDTTEEINGKNSFGNNAYRWRNRMNSQGYKIHCFKYSGGCRLIRPDGDTSWIKGGHNPDDAFFINDENHILSISMCQTIVQNLDLDSLYSIPKDTQGFESWELCNWDWVYSKKNNALLTANFDDNIYLWSMDGNCIALFEGHNADILSIRFSNDENYILSASHDGTVKLWDLKGNLVTDFKNQGIQGVLQAEFSPDESYIITSTMDYKFYLWNWRGELLGEFSGIGNLLKYAKISSDGDYIISFYSNNKDEVPYHIWLTPWKLAEMVQNVRFFNQ